MENPIVALRKRFHLTRGELALILGVSEATVSSWQRGNPSAMREELERRIKETFEGSELEALFGEGGIGKAYERWRAELVQRIMREAGSRASEVAPQKTRGGD